MKGTANRQGEVAMVCGSSASSFSWLAFRQVSIRAFVQRSEDVLDRSVFDVDMAIALIFSSSETNDRRCAGGTGV